MATIQVTPTVSSLGAVLQGLTHSDIIVSPGAQDSVILAGSSGRLIEFRGTALDAGNDANRWISGNVDSIIVTASEGGQQLFAVSGISVALSDIGALLDAGADINALNSFFFSGDDSVTGSSGNDLIQSSLGSDTIDGGDGIDTLDFSGSDTTGLATGLATGLIIDLSSNWGSNIGHLNLADEVVPGGTLEIINIENVVGTNLADAFWGDDKANVLHGWEGNDSVRGGAGDDTLLGGEGDDKLVGGSGNDYIVGGAGIDDAIFSGGLNDYDFVFNDNGQVVITDRRADDVSDGVDTLDGIEWLAFEGTAYNIDMFRPVHIADQMILEDHDWNFKLPEAFNSNLFTITDLNGDPLPSWIKFNALTQTLSGTPPKDFEGIIGIKVVADAAGYLKEATFNLTVEGENDTPVILDLSRKAVSENAANSTVVGQLSSTDPDKGDHVTYRLLDDAGGRFKLNGHVVQVANGMKLDYEQAQSHSITVQATDRFGASSTKTFKIVVTDVSSETVKGVDTSDVIKGGSGADKLYGGLGKDVLTGGKGKDAFVFNTKASKTNIDKVMDFNVKDDSIWLDNAVFTKLGKKGTVSKPVKMNKDFFTVGTKAKDKNDYIVYDNKKGVLYYDADGSGKGKAVEIATFSNKAKLTADDFFVV